MEQEHFPPLWFFIAIYLHDGPISNLSIAVIKPKKNVTVGFGQVPELLMLAAGAVEPVLKYLWPRLPRVLFSQSGAFKGSFHSEQVSLGAVAVIHRQMSSREVRPQSPHHPCRAGGDNPGAQVSPGEELMNVSKLRLSV